MDVHIIQYWMVSEQVGLVNCGGQCWGCRERGQHCAPAALCTELYHHVYNICTWNTWPCTHTLQPNPDTNSHVRTYICRCTSHSLICNTHGVHTLRTHAHPRTLTPIQPPPPHTHRSNLVTSRTLTICTVSPLLSTTWEAGGASAAEEGTAQGRGQETVCDIKE